MGTMSELSKLVRIGVKRKEDPAVAGKIFHSQKHCHFRLFRGDFVSVEIRFRHG